MAGSSTNTAVVLAGAVANGAFEAGALEVVAARGYPITRVLGTSAGALNAALLTRYLLAGEAAAGTAAMVKLWLEAATFWRVFRPSLRGLLKLEGLSSQDGLRELLRRYVEPVPAPTQAVQLRIVVTALRGQVGQIGAEPATTHEAVCPFGPDDFVSPDRLDVVFRAAVASAAFPGAFLPAVVPGLGPCSDGGIVNNTPLKHVLDDDVGRVIVVVPAPLLSSGGAPATVEALVGRIADIIVQERLYRDLREAELVNSRLAAIEELARRRGDAALAEELKVAAGLGGARQLEIVQIRPEKELPNPFAGFFDAAVRRRLVELGRAAATRALAGSAAAAA
jgi:NTE family protein